MVLDEQGYAYIVEEECVGCGMCIKACRFDPPRINMAMHPERKKWCAKKCDMCRNRPEGPACVQYCPSVCLGIDTAVGADIVDPEQVEGAGPDAGKLPGADVL